ncbi:MAG: hypothetical protein JWQ97_4050 [Phenylobacterium sp.]|nr:hypothetical protein [Phenylobacterium sp.]
MTDPLHRAAQFRALADAAESSREASSLSEVRAKHERARAAWCAMAEAEEVRQERRLEAARIAGLRQEQTCRVSDSPPAGAPA